MENIMFFADSLAIIVLLASASSYFIGAIPFGLFVSQLLTSTDVREIGSQSIGATNVLRTGSKSAALITLLLDCVKGAIPCAVFWHISPAPLALDLALIAGLCAILGHMYPCWLGFQGGKGVATALGVVLYLQPLILMFLIGIWLLSAAISRYSSVASITAFCTLPFLAFMLSVSLGTTAIFLVFSILIINRHQGNIHRLITGDEDSISLLDTPATDKAITENAPVSPAAPKPIIKPAFLRSSND